MRVALEGIVDAMDKGRDPHRNSITETLSSICNARRVAIAGAAHALTMDKPNEFNRAVLEFLNQTAEAAVVE